MFEPGKASCKNTRRYCLLWALTRHSFSFFFLCKKKNKIFLLGFSVRKPKIKSRGMCPALLFRTVRGVNRKVLGDKSVGLYWPLY